jgi:hypothetical protein
MLGMLKAGARCCPQAFRRTGRFFKGADQDGVTGHDQTKPGSVKSKMLKRHCGPIAFDSSRKFPHDVLELAALGQMAGHETVEVAETALGGQAASKHRPEEPPRVIEACDGHRLSCAYRTSAISTHRRHDPRINLPLTTLKRAMSQPKARYGFQGGGQQSRQEGAEQDFFSASGVIHKLEEDKIVGQLFLGDAPVRLSLLG